MTQITVFSQDVSILTVQDKKGKTHNITPHGALFRGGVFLAAMKDVALADALTRAGNGRYRTAAEVLGGAFPGVYRKVDDVIGTPWANKSTMATLLNAIQKEYSVRLAEGKKVSANMAKAMALVGALVDGKVIELVAPADVIENAA